MLRAQAVLILFVDGSANNSLAVFSRRHFHEKKIFLEKPLKTCILYLFNM
jgi:hypothetical protein